MGLSGVELAAWVEASCARQGVAVKVTDAHVVARIAVLLGSGSARSATDASAAVRLVRAERSEPPNEFDPPRVQGPGSGLARTDHGVVDYSGNDGVLACEVQLAPLGV